MSSAKETPDTQMSTEQGPSQSPARWVRLRRFLKPQMLTAIGTALLLGSWIVEHYWAAHWSSLKQQFERAREALIQIEIHESVNSTMLQYTAGLEPFNQRVLTTFDLSLLLRSFDEVAPSLEARSEILGVEVPGPRADDVRKVIDQTLRAYFPDKVETILKGTDEQDLSLPEIWMAGNLMDTMNRWAKAQQMFQAMHMLYDTTLSRIHRSELNASRIPGGKPFEKRFTALRQEIASGRDQFYETGVVLKSGSQFVNKANALRMEFGEFLRNRGASLSAQESQYKNWHRIIYLLGSLLLLTGIVLPKTSDRRHPTAVSNTDHARDPK